MISALLDTIREMVNILSASLDQNYGENSPQISDHQEL